ncbi:methyl-accepting chemotaxis sensor protein [Bacillus sp. OxB-1]|uniref:methyl-accepting chemotaxis protein n=1 Tax=Bacillus sp. (strain OxB-1) TaxID=98228 RepID=UPI0005822382|nr:methyl-accepting chemotaxis protein [Bacillus sp. OxB-1]BAQ11873.1 methyl-accepting chemotaxis sensor protein [Bacillus sp. OxB-1]
MRKWIQKVKGMRVVRLKRQSAVTRVEWSFKYRLMTAISSILLVSTTCIGFVTYEKSKENTIDLVSSRLEREVHIINDLAKTLMLAHVRDRGRFMSELEAVVKRQHVSLVQSGYRADMFYLEGEKLIPFSISKNRDLPISPSVLSKIREDRKGVLHETIGGEPYTLSFFEIQELGGEYIIAIPDHDYLAATQQMAVFVFVTIIISLLLGILLISWIIRNMTNPMIQLQQKMRVVREGDLRVDLTAKSNIPEIRSLNKSFQMMIASMSQMLVGVQQTSTRLLNTGQQLQQNSTVLLAKNELVKDIVSELGTVANETVSVSAQQQQAFHHMKESLHGLFGEMEDVSRLSARTEQVANTGEMSVAAAADSMQLFFDSMRQVVQTIGELQGKCESLDQIVNLIAHVTEQTRMLALNAKIEATRAGSAGAGFLVVANEVQRLAEQSNDATEKIKDMLIGMEQSVHDSASNVETMKEKGAVFQIVTTENGQHFQEAAVQIRALNEKLLIMSDHLHTLETAVPLLENVTVQVEQVSLKNKENAVRMLHSFQEQHEAMVQVEKAGLDLAALSDTLRSNAEFFQVPEPQPEHEDVEMAGSIPVPAEVV